MSYKLSKLIRLFQGAAFAALCFYSTTALAVSICSTNLQSLVQICKIRNSPANDPGCESLNFGTFHNISGACATGINRSAFVNYIGDEYRIIVLDGKWWPDSVYDPANRDSDNCFTVTAYSERVCSDNERWQDTDIYDSEGCSGTEGPCPGDVGWTDADGYDEAGFDAGGLDRGGNNAASGGGYFGGLGSGGTPPSYIDPPVPVDPQNGDNRDGNNVLQCYAAYPVTVSKTLLPASVQDGLAGCSNECAYQPTATIWDFNAMEEVVVLTPTGFVCSGEPAISVVDIVTFTAPPVGQEPPEVFDNLNACYLTNGGYFYCDHPLDTSEPDCYKNNNGWISLKFECPSESEPPLGTFNGVTQYIDPFSNCESFGGQIMCLDVNGNFIPEDSPDHVINGGNGDGDPNNDVFADAADVAANGQTTQERVVQALDARELAREIDERLADNFASLENAILSQDLSELLEGSSGEAESAGDGLIGSIGNVGSDSELSFDGSIIDPITNIVGSIIPSAGSCQTFTYDFLPSKGYVIQINTCSVSIVQPLLQWLVYAMTLLSLYNLALGNRGATV